jgi:hypothetical protein
MGSGGIGKRDTWHDGPTSSPTRYQDDMAVLGRKLGYRADDHGSTVQTAAWLPTNGNMIQGSGIVGTTGDVDYFAFYHGGGPMRIRVDVAPWGANLDARLELRSAHGAVLRVADPDVQLGASIDYDLPKGTYHAVVRSHGAYGDVGQYTLTGTGISTAGYSTTGPRVISSVLENPGVAPFMPAQTLLVTFDKPIDPQTFSTVDAIFVSPTGRRVAATRVESVPGEHAGRTFRVTANLPEYGTYRFEIGPAISDRFGNRMDQDGDGAPGESPQDRYSIVAVTRKMPTLSNISDHLNRLGLNRP